MELRKVAGALVHSQPTPLTHFLVPCGMARLAAMRQSGSNISFMRSPQRSLTTTATRSAAANKPWMSGITKAAPTSGKAPAGNTSSIKEESVEELTKSLWAAPSSRPSRVSPASFSKPGYPTATGEREQKFNGGSSAADLLAGLAKSSDANRNSSIVDLNRMMLPGQRTNEMMVNSISGMLTPRKERIDKLKLSPSTGRSVTLGNNIDVGRGFKLLEQSCARNKVKLDFNKQRFHERGGLKRKRLRRERWRKRFMEGFKATISRVKQLKGQGW